jgi:hypothetical protein
VCQDSLPGIAELLCRPGSDWESFAPPLPNGAINDAIKRINWGPLPAGLIDLYRICNAGEGSLPFQPWTFVLWGIDTVADTREVEHYRAHYIEFLFFGSNGGGEYFGLDKLGHVFFMDTVAGEESIVVAAESFMEFAAKLGFGAVPG